MRNLNGRLITGNVPHELKPAVRTLAQALEGAGIGLYSWVRSLTRDNTMGREVVGALRVFALSPNAFIGDLQELLSMCVHTYGSMKRSKWAEKFVGMNQRIALIDGNPVMWVSVMKDARYPYRAVVCRGAGEPSVSVPLTASEANYRGLSLMGDTITENYTGKGLGWAHPPLLGMVQACKCSSLDFYPEEGEKPMAGSCECGYEYSPEEGGKRVRRLAAMLSVVHLLQEHGLLDSRMNAINKHGAIDFTARPTVYPTDAEEGDLGNLVQYQVGLTRQDHRDLLWSNKWMTMHLGMGSDDRPLVDDDGSELDTLLGYDGRMVEDTDLGEYTVKYHNVQPLQPRTRIDAARQLRPNLDGANVGWNIVQARMYVKGGKRFLQLPKITYKDKRIHLPVRLIDREALKDKSRPTFLRSERLWNLNCAPAELRREHRLYGRTELDAMITALLERGEFRGVLHQRDIGQWRRPKGSRGEDRYVSCNSCKAKYGDSAPEKSLWKALAHADVCTVCGKEFWQVRMYAFLEKKYFPYLELEEGMTHIRVEVYGDVVRDYCAHNKPGVPFEGRPWHKAAKMPPVYEADVTLKKKVADAELKPSYPESRDWTEVTREHEEEKAKAKRRRKFERRTAK